MMNSFIFISQSFTKIGELYVGFLEESSSTYSHLYSIDRRYHIETSDYKVYRLLNILLQLPAVLYPYHGELLQIHDGP